MDYRLGVDLGTTWTAAAIARGGAATIVSLGRRSATVPTVVHFGADGTVLVGDAALRRAVDEPERIAREAKRRIGDDVPVLLGGTRWTPEQLQARVLRWVFDVVVVEEGSLPSAITVTHPANWGSFKLDRMRQAATEVGLTSVSFQPEPVAAAAWYANEHKMAVGDVVAVYDLGGGTFDVAVVRREPTGFALLGTPGGIERLGGVDFDVAVLSHVLQQAGLDGPSGADDRDDLAEVSELRQRCVEAKEALSYDSVASVVVRTGSERTTVRITRQELEAMIREAVRSTISTTRSVLASAGVAPADLHAVLLVGGSSRIPLVAEMITTDLGTPVALDANPKHAIALGAALHTRALPSFAAAPAAPPPDPQPAPPPLPPVVVPTVPLTAGPDPGGRAKPVGVLVGIGLFVLVAIVAAIALLSGGDGGDDTTNEVGLEDVEARPDDGSPATDTTGDDGSRLQTPQGEADEPPLLTDPEAVQLAQACFEGTMASCDDLYFLSDIGTIGETYAMTCGGRTEDTLPGSCLTDMEPTQPLPDPTDVPDIDDPEAQALAESCFDGDLTACDDLFFASPVGSIPEAYGGTCGGRLDESQSGNCPAAFDGPG